MILSTGQNLVNMNSLLFLFQIGFEFQTYPVCKISGDQTSLMISDFVESRKMATCDSKSAILLGKVI